MTDYILLQCKQAKIPLLSMRNNMRDYTMKFGGVRMTVNRFYEAWLATTIFSGDRQLTTQLIRSCIPDAGPDEIDGLIAAFIKDHPCTPVEYHYEDIPLMAIDNYYFEIQSPMFPTSIKLTPAQEQEVLDIIISPRISNKLGKMIEWFANYRKMYGVEAKLKRNQKWQDEELAWHFLLIHGINGNPLVMPRKSKQRNNETSSTERGGWRNILSRIFNRQ